MERRDSAWSRVTGCIFVFGALCCSWAVVYTDPEVTPASTASFEFEAPLFDSTRQISLPNSMPSEPPPAMPGGAAAISAAPDARTETPGRAPLHVFCSASSFRLIAARLERAFETQESGLDVILSVDSDRNCVGHLLVGTADVAMVGGTLSTKERSQGLQSLALGHHIVAPVLHRDNPVRSVHYDAFLAMLRGDLTDWSRVGGGLGRIKPASITPPRHRDLASDTLQFGPRLSSATTFMDSHQETLGYVSNNRDALGLVSRTSADGVRIVKVLAVDHIPPTLQFFKQGAWRFGSSFQAVFAEGPDERVRAWLRFLSSDTVDSVIRRVMTLPESP